MTKFSIQYRYLKEEGLPAGLNLKRKIVDYLRSSVNGHSVGTSATRRIVDLDQDGSVVILNRISDAERWDDQTFGGQLVQLQPGQNVPAIMQSLEEDADEFLMEQINLGQDAKIVKGVLYFVAIDNHVGLMEGQAVKGRTLERYLTNVLQNSGALEPGQTVILNGEFVAADGKQLQSATAITVAAEPNAHVAPGVLNELVGREIDRQTREGSTVFDVLRTLGWSDEAIQHLDREVPEGGWLEGLFSISIKERRRKRPISRATIAEALRNIDPADIGLDGEGREKGGIRKVSTLRSVRLIGSLKDPEDAIEQIIQALREWAERGTINCVFV